MTLVQIIGSVLLTYRTSSQSSAETSASLRELWVSSLPLFPSGPLLSHKGSAGLNMVQRVCVSLRWPASRHEMLRPEPQGKRSECVDALGAKRLASAHAGRRRQSTCGTRTSFCSAAAHAKLMVLGVWSESCHGNATASICHVCTLSIVLHEQEASGTTHSAPVQVLLVLGWADLVTGGPEQMDGVLRWLTS